MLGNPSVSLVNKNGTPSAAAQSIIQVGTDSDTGGNDGCTKIDSDNLAGSHGSQLNADQIPDNHTIYPPVKIQAPSFKNVDGNVDNPARHQSILNALSSTPSSSSSATTVNVAVDIETSGINQLDSATSNCDHSNQQPPSGGTKRVQFIDSQLDNSRQPTVIEDRKSALNTKINNRPRAGANEASQELINFKNLHSLDFTNQRDAAFHDKLNSSTNTHNTRQSFLGGTSTSESNFDGQNNEKINDTHANNNIIINNSNFNEDDGDGGDDDEEYEWYSQDIALDNQQTRGHRDITSVVGSPSRSKPKRATYVGRAATKLKFFTTGLTNKILGTSSSTPYTAYNESQDSLDLLTGATKYHRPISKRSSNNSGRTFRGSYRYSRIGIVMAIFKKLFSFITQRSTLALFGAFLIHITLGTIYTLSNVNSYLTSYMRKHGSPNATYGASMWLSSSFAVGQGLSMVLGGYLERRFSARFACFLGCALHSLSIMSTSKSIDYGHLAVLLTYGLLPGFGCGLAYMTPMCNGFSWFPNRKGLVAGVILAGFGIGSFVFNMAQTAFVNPQNLSPPPGGYFDQESILIKVPQLFIFLGTIYGSMQFVGCCLLFKPPNTYSSTSKLSDSRPILDEPEPMSIKRAIASREFVVLFLVYGITNQGVLFVNSMLKEYAQIFINNDLFLAWTASMASIANSLGRLIWGMAIDRFTFTQCFTTITAIFGTLMFLMPFEFVLSNKLLYLLCSLGIFGSFSGWMSTYPVHISRTFGNQISGVIYGLIFVSQSIGGICTAFAAHYLIDNYSRFVPFFCVTLLEILGLAIYHVFYTK